MDLPSIQQLGPLVIRILGQNPGKFTLQGTNTFLIGRTAPYILIDTGEGKPEYISQLKAQLDTSPSPSDACPISDVILTHKHFDHHGGLTDVLGHLSARGSWTPPRVHIHPLPPGASDQSLGITIAAMQPGTYTPHSDSPFFPLSDGSKLRTQDGSAELEVVHTPGHTTDSICLVLSSLSSSQPKPEALFTADTVLGAGTGVFENLSTYMSSLKRLVALPIWPVYLHPGHGPSIPLESAKAHVETYISHREARENQIIGVLKGGEGQKGASITVGEIVKTLYAEYPERLWAAAAHGVRLHLKKLESEGRVRKVGSRSSSPSEGMEGARMEEVGAAGMDVEWEWKEDGKL